MNKLLIFLLLGLFLLPFASASDILVKTNITLNAVSWLDGDGVTKMNITIFTENIDGEQNLVINGVHETFNNFFGIDFIRDLSCNQTTEGQIQNYITSCDGGDCKDKYYECKYSKQSVVDSKGAVDALLSTCQTDRDGNKNQADNYKNNYDYYLQNSTQCYNSYHELEDDSKNKSPSILILIALIVGGLIGNYGNNKGWWKKTSGEKGEEEKHGIDYSITHQPKPLPPR